MKLKVAVIFGGRTCEHDVSIISGLQAFDALDRNAYEPFCIYISNEGKWYVGDALNKADFYKKFDAAKVTKVYPAGENGRLKLMKAHPVKKFFGKEDDVAAEADVVVPVMHGLNGEDGTLEGMLELFAVPYTAAGVLGSSVGMDKIAMKLLFKGLGFPVVDGIWFDRASWGEEREKYLDMAEKQLGYPMYVKPANLGSSIGISRADDREGLEDAIDTACAYDRRILVEKGIVGLKEVNCSVLGYGSDVQTSELEMPVTQKEMLDFSEKYLRNAKGGSKGMQSLSRIVPAPVSKEIEEEVRRISVEAFKAMDLKGVVRIDYILDADDKLYINEVNVIPGSLAFYLWDKKGLSFAQLLDKMIECAYRASADRNSSVFSYDSSILDNIVSGSKGKLGR